MRSPRRYRSPQRATFPNSAANSHPPMVTGPAKKPPRHQEDQICMAFFNRLTCEHPKFVDDVFHIPNGVFAGDDHIARQKRMARFKRMGVKRGTSDYFCMVPVGEYSGLWVEVKTKTNYPDQAQRDHITLARLRGYAAAVAYGDKELWEIFDNYLKGNHALIQVHLCTLLPGEKKKWRAAK